MVDGAVKYLQSINQSRSREAENRHVMYNTPHLDLDLDPVGIRQ